MVSHRVGQRSYGVVKDEQVFVLVLAEGKHKGVQDERQVGHQFCASLLLQRGKGTFRERFRSYNTEREKKWVQTRAVDRFWFTNLDQQYTDQTTILTIYSKYVWIVAKN